MADPAFVWGAGGAQMTPEQIAAQRQVAQAMMARGSDYSPVQSPWQGVARVAEAMMGGLDARKADSADKANAGANRDLIAKMIEGAASNAPAVAAAAPPASPAPSGGVQVASLGTDVPAAAVSRPAVLPTPKVWGDREAEDAGLYEKPAAKVAATMPAAPPAIPSPAVATVAGSMSRINPAVLEAATSPYAAPATRQLGIGLLTAAMKPKEQFTEYTDAEGNRFKKNLLTNEPSILLKKDKEATPTSVLEYNFYKSQTPNPMPYETWATAKARAGAMNVGNVTTNAGGTDKQIFDAFDERAKQAQAAATGLVALRNARSALDSSGGAVTGAGADTRLALQKVGAALGITDPAAVQNTETFRSAIAPQVAAMLKATVGTTNISNSDREFAEKAAGGNIGLEGGSIRRLLDIMERASVGRLQQHQEQLDAVYPDPVAHKKERALFGIKVPDAAAPPPPAGATASGVKWSVE